MLSSMSYAPPPTQTDVFADSLRSRLISLKVPISSRPAENETEGEPAAFYLKNKLFPGTSFPPTYDNGRRRLSSHALPSPFCLPAQSLPTKCYSEPDLKQDNDAQMFTCGSSGKTILNRMEEVEEKVGDLHPLHKLNDRDLGDMSTPPVESIGDSDLFFDFDIEHDAETTVAAEVVSKEEEKNLLYRLNSIEDSENGSSTRLSTAYCSNTSPTSDVEEVKRSDGLSLDPFEWKHCMLRREPTPLVVTGSSTNTSSTTWQSSQDEKSTDDSSTEEDISKGLILESKVPGEKDFIDGSKLAALLSLLGKDKEYKAASSASKRSSHGRPKHERKEDIICGSVPASFPPLHNHPSSVSNLTSSVAGREKQQFEDLNRSDKKGIKRCESAPALGDKEIDVTLNVSDESDEAITNNTNEAVQEAVRAEVSSHGSEPEEQIDTRSKYRRCSSLKSGKTPPGSPRKRKIVRFADLFGLDLANVKMYMDEVPRVPKSAFQDLKDADISNSDFDSDSGSDKKPSTTSQPKHAGSVVGFSCSAARLQPLFSQPSGTPTLLNNLRDKKVSLEAAYVVEAQSIVKGVVRVVNLDFHKRVIVRYTTNDWSSFNEKPCSYLSGTCDGFSDKFSFVLDCGDVMGRVGGRIQLCIRFECLANTYWDNNNGANYIFQYFSGESSRVGINKNYSSRTRSYTMRVSKGSGRPYPLQEYPPITSQSPSGVEEDPWLKYL